MSLEETKARLRAASDTKEALLTLINDLYVGEIRSNEKVLKEALSELHNSGDTDLINIVSNVDKSSSGHDFFTILHAFENTLPSLDASIEDVLHCLLHLTQQAGRDLAIAGVYGAFESFCKVDVQRARDSVRYILEQTELSAYAPFLSSAILSYDSGHIAEAIQLIENLIENRDEMVRSQAYFTLGKLDVGETQASVIWDLLSRNASSEHESGCCASILRAILYFGETFPSYWSEIEELLFTFFEGAESEVLYVISDIVAFQRVNLPENVLHLLVKKLANVSPEHKGIIDNIDHLLVNLVESGSLSVAVELLESILAAGVKLPWLDYFSSKLLNEHQGLLNHIITKWFLSGASSLCHGVSDLLHGVTGTDIELEAEMELLSGEVKQIFVGYKAIGWLFTQPIAAASFILSIYDTASTTTRKELEQVLYDPLLISYPGELKRFFQSRIDKGVQNHLCECLLGKLQAYHADIEKVSGLKELIAPTENVSAYWKEFNKGVQVAHEDASKSSLMSLFTTQRLLYGNSSIYYLHLGDGEQVRQEAEMQSFSHSTEMPRLSVIDPENLDYTLRFYRYGRMKNEVDS